MFAGAGIPGIGGDTFPLDLLPFSFKFDYEYYFQTNPMPLYNVDSWVLNFVIGAWPTVVVMPNNYGLPITITKVSGTANITIYGYGSSLSTNGQPILSGYTKIQTIQGQPSYTMAHKSVTLFPRRISATVLNPVNIDWVIVNSWG